MNMNRPFLSLLLAGSLLVFEPSMSVWGEDMTELEDIDAGAQSETTTDDDILRNAVGPGQPQNNQYYNYPLIYDYYGYPLIYDQRGYPYSYTMPYGYGPYFGYGYGYLFGPIVISRGWGWRNPRGGAWHGQTGGGGHGRR